MKTSLLYTVLIALTTGLSATLVAQENTAPAAVPTRVFEHVVTITAKVESVDPDKREITLKGPLGNVETFDVSDEVKRLNEVKAGDLVTIGYYLGVVAELRAPTEEEKNAPLVVLRGAAKAVTGSPEARGGRVIRVVATVEGVDRPSQTATLKGPAGRYVTVRVADPSTLEKVHLGDTVVVTCAEALAVSVEKVSSKGGE